MKEIYYADRVSHTDIVSKCNDYDSTIPQGLEDLEQFCRGSLPQTLAKRKSKGDAFLTKAEVTKLLQWKLKHGKFRPSLPKLLASNSEEEIETATRDGFATYTHDPVNKAKALDALVKLRGIGPATASLILSRYDQEAVPFFSDELFRYMHFEDKTGRSWDRKISYSSKDYKSMLEKVDALRLRVNQDGKKTISAEDVEKAAYVLFKEDTHMPSKRDATSDAKTPGDSIQRKRRKDDGESLAELVSDQKIVQTRRKRRRP